jgi:hypothetical protein
VTLTDAGPLVALVARDQSDHRRCLAALLMLSTPLVTTMAVFTEAMHLLGRGGWRLQDALWQFERRGRLVIHELSPAELARCYELMHRYRDLPMDLADATLVASAEQIGQQRVFTLDAHFAIYRTSDGRAFELVP